MKKNDNLTKYYLSKSISNKTGLSFTLSKKLIEDLLKSIEIVVKKEKVYIKNFGTFKILKKKERLGRNPKTKETFIVKARKSISFKVSKNF